MSKAKDILDMADDVQEIKKYIREIKDFPKKGVILRDLTLCYSNWDCFSRVIDTFKANLVGGFDYFIGIDAKGFIFSSVLAYKLGKGLVLVRKKGKLAGRTIEHPFTTEYSEGILEIDVDSFKSPARFVFVDDVLATGGTSLAVAELLKKLHKDNQIIQYMYVISLKDLDGIDNIYSQYPFTNVFSIFSY